MKRFSLFISLIVITLSTLGQFGYYNSYHFVGVEQYAFDWQNGEEAHTSFFIGTIEPSLSSNSYFVIRYEDGEIDWLSETGSVIYTTPVVTPNHFINYFTANDGEVYVGNENGIQNIVTGEFFPGTEGFISSEFPGVTAKMDYNFNRLYWHQGGSSFFMYKDLANNQYTMISEDDLGMSFYGLWNFVVMDDGKLLIASDFFFIVDMNTAEVTLVENTPYMEGGHFEFLKASDGSYYFAYDEVHDGGAIPKVARIKNGEVINTYDIIGNIVEGTLGLYIDGIGPVDNTSGCYFWYFEPETGTTAPVVASGVTMQNNIEVSLINNEFWFYSQYGIATNIVGVMGYYGYPVARLTDDEVVGIEDSQISLFDIYPNPATNWIKVKGLPVGTPIWLKDITGQNVSINMIDENTVDISQLASGIYVLNGQKFVIQR